MLMAKLGKKKKEKEDGKEEDSDDHAGDDWGHGRPSILYTPNSISGLSLVKVIYIPSAIKTQINLVAFWFFGFKMYFLWSN